MQEFLVFALTMAYVSTSTYQDQPEIDNNSNIGNIHGHNALPCQFPYQVRLLMKKDQERAYCGGSLIDHRWFLTAGSCTVDADNVTVQLGSQNSSPYATHIVNKKDIIAFKDFNDSILFADISLIRIPYVEYNKNIQPVKLPKIQPHFRTYADSEVVITGWENTFNASSPDGEIFHYAILKIINNTDCRAVYGEIISSALICASTSSDISPWIGDSSSSSCALGVVILLAQIDPILRCAETRIERAATKYKLEH
ncbi:collagenase-like [Drosophila sulfurigaster albostrigata]|uniref:collagenase-like n=1 Tax=Drosophila sulfurigaster albostrigata TaxID=89887 RepID=UPI002D2191FE|nr:collagenase-like [Drosophila sulfurigaster albostrigata]